MFVVSSSGSHQSLRLLPPECFFGVHMGLLEDESVFKGHLDDLSRMLSEGKIDPIIDGVWRFEDVADAQMHMHDRKNKGKVLLDFSPQ